MAADKRTVDETSACIINSFEMQQATLAFAQNRRVKRTAVPHDLRRLQLPAHAREERLGRKRHDNVLNELLFFGNRCKTYDVIEIVCHLVRAVGERAFPQPVERLIRFARKLGVGMLFQHVLHVERLAPWRIHRLEFCLHMLLWLGPEHFLHMQHSYRLI